MTFNHCRLSSWRLLVILTAISTTSLSELRAQDPIEGASWFPIGPAPISGFFTGGVVGRASAIAVNPFNTDELWIGGATGGVWHSIDGGRNWTPLTDDHASLAIGSLAIDDCDSEGCRTIYAGTGENAIRRDTYYGRGLLVFGRGDEIPTWSLRTGDPFDFALGSIRDVIVDPGSERVFVTLSSGTTSSASQATVTAPEPSPGGYGIYRSDDSFTWVKLAVEGTTGGRPTDLEIHPDHPQTLYAGFLGLGVFKSTDGGDSWCPLNQGVSLPIGCDATAGLAPDVPGGFDHVEIAIHPADPDTVYASFGHCADRLIQRCEPSIFRSLNGGMTWEKRSQGATTASYADCVNPAVYSRYSHSLTVLPGGDVLLAGISICRSTDGAQSFVQSDGNRIACPSIVAPNVCPTEIHSDHREIVVHPADSARIYCVGDGGFAFSTDGGYNWTPSNDDLQITGFYSIASSPATPRVLGGAQDNSGQLWTGLRNWDHTGSGDGAFAVIDRVDPLKMFLGGNFGSLDRSGNGGESFSTTITPSGAANKAFNAPVVQDTVPPHPLYYGADQLFCSTTSGDSWNAISPVLALGPAPEIVPATNVITAIGVHGPRVFVGYYGGQVFTSDAGCSIPVSGWTDVGDGLPASPVTDFAIDPSNPSIAYVAFSGFGSEAKVWKTTTAGNEWVPMADGIPAGVPVNALAVEPDHPERVWLGLDGGPEQFAPVNVYRSTDAGMNWEPRNDGLPNAPVHDLSIDGSRARIYAALHGRGAYVLSQPFVGTFEGWVDEDIWDVPVYGHNFPAGAGPCTITLLQRTGEGDDVICTSGTVDRLGGTIRTTAESAGDPGGRLSSTGSMWEDKEVVWACLNRFCLNDAAPDNRIPIGECNDDEDGDGVSDPLSTAVVECGGPPGNATISGCPDLTNPPGSLMEIGFFEPGTFLASAVESRAQAAGAGRIFLSPILQTLDTSRRLCSVTVPIQVGDDAGDVLARARDLLSSDPECAEEGIVATLLEVDRESFGEDPFPGQPRLSFSAPSQTGGEIVAGVRVAPGGTAPGACFTANGLGTPVLGQLRIMRTSFLTSSEGATGGRIVFYERSGLGTCALEIPTTAGQTAGEIAQTLQQRILAPEDPEAKPFCKETSNPRDVHRDGDSVISVLASGLTVCLDDPGVGFEFATKDLPMNRDPECDGAELTPDRLWPPNHGFREVEITGVDDPDEDTLTISVTDIAQDEPVQGRGNGRTCPDAGGINNDMPSLRAERSGHGDGRVYHVEFQADDGRGGHCTGTLRVCVPHDKGKGEPCIDQGPLYPSIPPRCVDGFKGAR